MKIAIDLHIHSCLSPCASNDMTPNNIINMACLKKLDAIAVTDHNSAKNMMAIQSASKGRNLLIVPGIEIQTKEDVHILCYFLTIQHLLGFEKIIYDSLPDLQNIPEISYKNYFGEQYIVDQNDAVVAREHKLLYNSVNLSIDEVVKITNELGGVSIPAHINRNSNSILVNLGFIPTELNFNFVEIDRKSKSLALSTHNYQTITSSDAHDLGNILEREYFIDIFEYSVEGIINALKTNSSL